MASAGATSVLDPDAESEYNCYQNANCYVEVYVPTTVYTTTTAKHRRTDIAHSSDREIGTSSCGVRTRHYTYRGTVYTSQPERGTPRMAENMPIRAARERFPLRGGDGGGCSGGTGGGGPGTYYSGAPMPLCCFCFPSVWRRQRDRYRKWSGRVRKVRKKVNEPGQ
jgi:hypothetical protein